MSYPSCDIYDVESIELVDRFMGCPNTVTQIMQALGFHPAVVTNVNAPTGDGRVQVQCLSLGWNSKESNWIQIAGNHIGNNNPNKHHSGHWNPPQPGGYGYVYFPGGNMLKPAFMAGNITMSQPGSSG